MAKIATFADAFPGTTLNAANWYLEPDSSNGQPSGVIAVSGGTLALNGGTYSDTGYYTSVNSQAAWDLTASAVFVKVTAGESGTGDGDTGIAVLASNFSDGYNYDVTGGNLQVQKTVSDSPTVLHTAAYNATAMAWLRIREASGTIYFEYAATASGSYTTLYSTTTETVSTWTAATSYVQLFYGSDSGASKPTGTAGFQDLNTVPGGGAGFTAAGSAITPAVTGLTFPLTPHAVGDVVVIEVISTTAADYATALSSSNVAWDASPLVAHASLSANAVAATVFKGQVTSTATATVTVTVAAGTPVLRAAGQEFSASGGYASVQLDASGTVNAATTLCPSLTPGYGAGEAYFYYGFNAASATAGSTSGYAYAVDANGNGLCYDASCGSGAQQPAWGASDTISGIAVLLYQSSASLAASASLTVTPSRSATAVQGGPGGRTAALAVTPAASASHRQAHAGRASLALTPAPVATGVRTGLVQEVSGSTTGTSLTLTFPKAVTLGSAVIVCVAGFYDGGVTGMTLGTTGGTFSHFASSGGTGGNNASVFGNLSAAQSSAALTITTSAAGILAWAYEVAGTVAYFDTAKGSTGTGASWTSTATTATVPYQHFVVGIGSVVANSGSITSTGSGWTNESAITNVVGAGSHAVGAVSGYRQPATSGTYAYSGTSSSTSAWGAVTAAFLVLPRGGNTWGGYIFTEHAGYTGITASFTLPSSVPLAPAICSIWVGIGNVYQTGVYLSSSSSFTGNVGSSAWSWWFGGGGGAGELWDAATYPAGAGDSLSLSLTCDGAYWYATVTNHSRGWSYAEPKSVLGNNVGCWGYNATTGAPGNWGWIYPAGMAEVAIEQEGGAPNQLPDYGVITFTGVTTTPATTVLPSPQFTVPSVTGSITQYPGAYNLASGSFTMTWNAAD